MSDSVTRYVRYAHEGGVSYGILDGETIKEIAGGLFGERAPDRENGTARRREVALPL